ncbi:MAG TPA: two-component regulator propeller domain-containing protein [Flavisolibacter sp.]|nr:two-component regulator propeller domain-containing protein [Flavisolibacter sp.]
MKKKTIAFFLCLLFLANAEGQQGYYFRHYQVENGLSHNTVMCSVQDSQGFLWLGTKDGLNRFDGTSFKVFRHDEDDSTTIGNDYIRYLHLDREGRLFAGTQRGLYQYQPLTESFQHIPSSGTKSIKEITTDAQGNLWFIAEGDLVCIDKKTKRSKQYDKAINGWATSMCTTSDGAFWIALADGNLKRYGASGNFSNAIPVYQQPVNTPWVEKIYPAENGRLLIGTAAYGLLSMELSTKNIQPVISQNEDKTGIYVRDILQNKNDEYWLATESGLFIYNAASGNITNLKKNYHDPYSLSDNAVYTLCKDKEGGLWAGTFFGGVNYYVEQHAIFQKYFPDYSQTSISGNAVREIVKDKFGNLWIGTEDAGLNKIDASGKITHFMPTGSKNSLAYYNIHGLLADDENLWVGTFEHGLDILHIPSGKVIKHYEAGPGAGDLKSNFIFSVYRTSKGQILLATTSGVFAYHKTTDSFSPVPQLSGYTYHIIEDSKGVWWSATISEGIKFYNPATGRSGSFQYNAKNKQSISNNMVNSVFEDGDGNLWIATEGGGVCKLDAARKTVKRYNTKNGLPSNFVFKVLEDETKQLWITTSKGLVRFHPQTEAITTFTSANGLLNDQFNYSSGLKDETGRLYFGSVKGMISFDPGSFRRNDFVPPVYITGFQVHNNEVTIGEQSLLKQSILFTKAVELAHDQSSFSIDFAALSYTAPQMNTYAYKMEGIDTKWNTLEKNRKVYFTNLAPGKYTFKLKAANGSGVWNENETTFTIVILPPWWQSSAAYTIYSLLVLGLAIFAFRSYHLRMKRKSQERLELLHFEKEKELYEAKMKFFTNIAHEIRTPLTLIKGPLERVINLAAEIPGVKNSLAIMERNTNRLIELTNQLLDYRQTEAGGFTLSFTEENISQLLQDTYFSFKPLAEKKRMTYNLHLAKEPLIAYADGEALTKILSNLFSNAIKYGEKKVMVRLLFQAVEKTFTIEIKNDGDTVPEGMQEKIFEPFVRLKKNEKQKGTGIGLALARSLAQLHGGTLQLKTEEGCNVFVLTLPVYQEKQLSADKTISTQTSISELNA